MSELRQRYEGLLQRPEIRSLLNTIRYAEGTPGEAGYRTMFGGGQFDTSKGWQHPDRVISSGRYKSTAAGAYQFLTPTWQSTSQALGLPSFDPKSQDLAALYLIDKRRGALEPFLKGEKFGTVINKLAPEWSSLPTSGGGSYYGQPSKKLSDLYQYYEQQKQKQAGVPAMASQQTQPAQTPTGLPNINIIVTGKGRVKSTGFSPLDFLQQFRAKTALPSPQELAQQMVTTEPVDYFKM